MSTLKTRMGLVFAIVFVFGAVGLDWYLQGAAGTESERKETSPLATKLDATNAGQALPNILWQEDAAQAYRLSMDSTMRLNMFGSGVDQATQVTLRAMLELRTLKVAKEQTLAGMQLSDLQLIISGQADPDMNRLLEQPFRVSFGSGGVPEEFEFSEGLTRQEQTMLENIVRTFTVSMPASQPNGALGGAEWLAQEGNASGFYQATYIAHSPGQFEKRKGNFVASASSPLLANATINSTEMIGLDSRYNWLSHMTVSETLRTSGKTGPTVNVVNRATIELLFNVQARGASDRWNFVAAAPLSDPIHSRDASVKLSPEEARQQLRAELPKLNTASQGRTQHIHALRDFLRADGSVPAVLLEQLKNKDFTDRTRADLYLALELAGTAEAQAALTSVITDSEWSARDALRATVALAGIDNPSAATLAVLWDTAVEGGDQTSTLSTTATYTLGSMGSRMKATNNPNYADLRDDLVTSAYGTRAAQQRAAFVYALGNTRDAEIASDIGSFLADEQPAVRRAAALSLGLTQAQQSADLLMTHFQRESNSAVRGAIAESLIALPVVDTASAMVMVGDAIQLEKDEGARHSMANFMGKNLTKHPEFRPVFQKLLRQEPSKRVRQVIAEALATL